MKYQGKNRKSASMFSGKGFYISLAVCLLAISVTAFFAISRTGDILNGEDTADLSSAVVSADEWGLPQNANANQSNVEITSSEAQTGQFGSSSSEISSAKEKSSSSQNVSSESARIYFAKPVSGKIIQKYSNGELVKSTTMNDWRTHDGIDIAAKVTTPVKAAYDGTVASITSDELWGVVVTIDHENGYVSKYCGLNTTVNVKKGQKVKLGDVIGSVGETSVYETNQEPHIHFEVLKNDRYVNPLKLIKE